MCIPIIHCLAALLFLLLPAFGVNAAEVRVHNRSLIILSGEIEKGDYDKVLSTAKKAGPGIDSIFLASPGGDLIEAMRIGRLVRQLKWSSEAPDFIMEIAAKSVMHGGGFFKELGFEGITEEHQLVCASSCFFIYAGGIYRSGDEIGIHRPYFSKEDYARMGGNEVIGKSKTVASMVEDYLKEMGVPSRFSEIMFSTQKDSIRWLNHEELKELNRYAPGLDDLIDSKCGSRADQWAAIEKIRLRFGEKTPEGRKLTQELRQRHHDCWDQIMQEMRQEAWHKFFDKNNANNESVVMSKLTFLIFPSSFILTIILWFWKQSKRPLMHMRWVFSPIWICLLILYGEFCFKNQLLPKAGPACVFLTIIFVALKLLKKVEWKWGWTLCPIWFWAILNIGAILNIISVGYIEPKGLPF
ncbi:MAG: hypothetical protein RBT11_01205 [Desulfobacterales bacterium]|jgi:hypothetical protein|nr:hypothetical protein [Desulfobacterales bacterium]